jgi:hypothetical protein
MVLTQTDNHQNSTGLNQTGHFISPTPDNLANTGYYTQPTKKF